MVTELHPGFSDRFAGFVACLSMNNPDESERELHRAIRDLGARGVQIFSNIGGLPLDRPEFQFLFEVMGGYDLPIWLHPARGANFPDYLSKESYLILVIFLNSGAASNASCILRFGNYGPRHGGQSG